MNGILLIDKEKNYTSRDVVNIVGKKFKTKKVGHTGTLDPLATGVLVVTIGEATKISELLTSTYKEYVAEVILGESTDTLDITGKLLEEKDVFIEKNKIIDVLKNMTKSYMQEVPIYSAVKVDGKKLYEYARNNEEVVLPKKLVDIKELELLDYKNKDNKTVFKMRCLVSKGTYIRSLIKDIADNLNTIGVMSELRRTKQGNFSVENCYKLSDLEKENFDIIKIEESLDLYTVIPDDNLEFKIRNGQIIDNIYNEDIVMFKKTNVIGIYKKYDKDPNKLKPWKMFNLK